MEVNIREGTTKFWFDFEKCYWSSKLANERVRMLKILTKEDILADMFAGVGPLAVQAAKKGITTYANDLNPDCYSYMMINTKSNKIEPYITWTNQDAREFIRDLVETDIMFTHAYLNLPADAIEFLDVFYALFSREKWETLPILHVYAFSTVE